MRSSSKGDTLFTKEMIVAAQAKVKSAADYPRPVQDLSTVTVTDLVVRSRLKRSGLRRMAWHSAHARHQSSSFSSLVLDPSPSDRGRERRTKPGSKDTKRRARPARPRLTTRSTRPSTSPRPTAGL